MHCTLFQGVLFVQFVHSFVFAMPAITLLCTALILKKQTKQNRPEVGKESSLRSLRECAPLDIFPEHPYFLILVFSIRFYLN